MRKDVGEDKLLQLAMMFFRISEWLHWVGILYGGRSLTLFRAPRQSKRMCTEPVRSGDTLFTA
jgi:hypothetical protein